MRTLLLAACLLGSFTLSSPATAADDATPHASTEVAPETPPAAAAPDTSMGCAQAGCPGAAGGCCTGKATAATGEPKKAGCNCGSKARPPKVEQ